MRRPPVGGAGVAKGSTAQRPANRRRLAAIVEASGTPSGRTAGAPAPSNGWHTSSRQPRSEGWQWLLTAWPTTRAGIMVAQTMRRFSTITQRRMRVNVFGVVTPSPVVVAIEYDR